MSSYVRLSKVGATLILSCLLLSCRMLESGKYLYTMGLGAGHPLSLSVPREAIVV